MKRTHNAFVRVLALMLAVVLTAGMCTIGVNAATLNVGSNDVMIYGKPTKNGLPEGSPFF